MGILQTAPWSRTAHVLGIRIHGLPKKRGAAQHSLGVASNHFQMPYLFDFRQVDAIVMGLASPRME